MNYLETFEKYVNEINLINCYEPEAEFKWEMGLKAIAEVSPEPAMTQPPQEIQEIYGIPVIINYDNPEMIKLWKSVTL